MGDDLWQSRVATREARSASDLLFGHRGSSRRIYQNDGSSDSVGTWGGYVQLLDNEASYLGQLGEDVTDVNRCGASPSSRPTTR